MSSTIQRRILRWHLLLLLAGLLAFMCGLPYEPQQHDRQPAHHHHRSSSSSSSSASSSSSSSPSSSSSFILFASAQYVPLYCGIDDERCRTRSTIGVESECREPCPQRCRSCVVNPDAECYCTNLNECLVWTGSGDAPADFKYCQETLKSSRSCFRYDAAQFGFVTGKSVVCAMKCETHTSQCQECADHRWGSTCSDMCPGYSNITTVVQDQHEMKTVMINGGGGGLGDLRIVTSWWQATTVQRHELPTGLEWQGNWKPLILQSTVITNLTSIVSKAGESPTNGADGRG
jgi:hypothetical protein